MRASILFAAAAVAAAVLPAVATAQFSVPEPTKPDGATLFAQQCATCHVVTADGGPRQGPNLAGVFGRTAGTLPGFKYAGDFASTGIVWDPATLDAYLTNPQALVKGSVMAYRQANPEIRQTIITWLREHS